MSYSQNIAQLESQADEWATKSYTQTKALSGYLSCFRNAVDFNTKQRVLIKSSSVLASRKLLLGNDAAIADSLIEESRGQFGEDTTGYLSLVENRIVFSGNAAGKYLREFDLLEEVYKIRDKYKYYQGVRYEQVLRKHIRMLIYKRDLPSSDKQEIYDRLWLVYLENNQDKDTLDLSLVDSYASQCYVNDNPYKAVELLEMKKGYLETHLGKENHDYIKTLDDLCRCLGSIYSKEHSYNEYVLTEEKKKECAYRKESLLLKAKIGEEIQSFEAHQAINAELEFCKDTAEAQNLALVFSEQAALLHGKESEAYCDALNQMANASFGEDRAKYRLEMLETKKRLGTPWEYVQVEQLVEELKRCLKDTTTAIRVAKEFAQQTLHQNGKRSEQYCNALSVLATAYGDHDRRGIEVLEELLSLEEKVHGKDSPEYTVVQMRLFSASRDTHQQETAIAALSNHGEEAVTQTLMLKATQQMQYGQYREAISTYGIILEQYATGKIVYMPGTADYLTPELKEQIKITSMISSVMGIVNCYKKLKNIDEMLAFAEKWDEDQRLDESVHHFIFTNVASMSGLYGTSNAAVINFIDRHIAKHGNASTTQLAEMKLLKANAYIGMEHFEDAKKTIDALVEDLSKKDVDKRVILRYEIAQEICAMALATNNPDSAALLEEAMRLNKKALLSMEQLDGYKDLVEYRSLCCRSIIYEDLLDHSEEVLRLCRELDGFDSEEATQLDENAFLNASLIDLLTMLLDNSVVETQRFRAMYRTNMKEESESLMKQNMREKMEQLRFALVQLDNSLFQSTMVWTNQVNDELCNIIALTNSDSLTIMLYDYTLLYKQAYLTALNLMRSQILFSDNVHVKEKFEELQQLRKSKQNLESLGISDNQISERIVQLERQLVEDSKMFGDFTKDLDLTWKDIQSKLKSDEAAIEFLSYNSFDKKTKIISALVLRQEWNHPKFVKLVEEEALSANIYNDTVFSKLLWGGLDPYLKGVKKIYFAPAGELYTMGIESLLHPSGKGFISDFYVLYRLSSTRELMKSDYDTIDDHSAIIYGGIAYDATVKEIAQNAELYKDSHPTSSSNTRALRAAVKRAVYLPGTKRESLAVDSILRSGQIKTRLLTDVNATEASFRVLSQQKVDIIHIATHGLYAPSDKSFSISRFFTSIEEEDQILTRSGLLLAGANNALLEEEVLKGVDDGILTAFELSTLDLKEVDLVVLSACETGKGDITGDGVFGLQRGFKMAGVNSIIMSLWKVDDDATRLLMTEFYKNWMGGMSKHDALEKAKQAVRTSVEKDWSDPNYWAAFVLLDGLSSY